jgi:hippurate hydrolase
MNFANEIRQNINEIVEIRRDIHANPETCFEENRTAGLISEKLSSWGIEVHRGLGRTGVVGVLRGNGKGGKSIGLRADMDALPMQEENDFSHRSLIDGKMHACGHDGHVAMLLSAAQVLSKNRSFNGTVNFIFQPAEEGGCGANEMIHDGLFEKFPCDAIFALHNWPGISAGQFATRKGAIMASCNEFRITVTGKGSHAALPHTGADPIFTIAQIINGLQAVITRNKSPIDAAVLSITQIHAGSTFNVIPDSAWIAGTVRTFSLDVLNLIEERMRSIAQGTASVHGCSIKFDFTRQSPPTVNDPDQTAFAVEVMRDIVGKEYVDDDVEPTMGAEDFSSMLEKRPGCYAFIGNGDGNHRERGHGLGPCMLHNTSYDFNDEIITLGATYWVRLVTAYLS